LTYLGVKFTLARIEARPLLELLGALDDVVKERQRLTATAASALRDTRKGLGMSQSAFADVLGVSVPYLSMIENGQRGITTSTLNNFREKISAEAEKLGGEHGSLKSKATEHARKARGNKGSARRSRR
jgi:hypothetical protein